MTRRIPTIRNGTLHEDAEETASREAIVVESVAWYAWVEHHRSFRFECPASTFTARKERRAGGWYWYAYRRQAGRLHTAYLGRSAELSATRLQAIAAALAGADGQPTPRTAASRRMPDLPASHSHERANVTPGPVPPHNLPRQLTSLVGREQEVATAEALLQRPEVRLLSMVGTAGVGKTRLALQVALDLLEHFADGVFFVALAPIRDPELVLATVAQTLGLRVMGDQSFLDVLKVNLRDKHCLLALDNFEQVVSAAPQLSDLLEACPDVKLLITSREVLHLRAEQQFSVPPLALPDRRRLPDEQALAHVAAVELFLHRAQAISSDFHVTMENAADIAEICLRLDGLPLAIELAAARIKVFTPQALLARMDRRLQVLTGGARDLPLRQRTLRSTIAWSYELLPVEEQRLFHHLAVFVGGCILEAVEAVSTAVGDTEAHILEGMVSLVDKSLLQQTGRDGEEPRFAMLETIREYGLEVLVSCGEAHDTHQAHAAYYLALVEQAEQELTGPQQLSWLERLEREHDNLRATIAWLVEHHEQEAALRLCGALWRFWWIRGYLSEGRTELTRALVGSRGVVAMPVRAKALHAAGELANMQGDFEEAEALCGESLALFRTLGDPRGSALSLSMLGYAAAWQRSDFATARALLEEAVTLFREVDDTYDITLALVILATVFLLQGEYERACTLVEEAMVLDREGGDSWRIANSLWLLGLVMFFQGDFTRAHALLEESLALARREGYTEALAYALFVSGQLSLQQGDVAMARLLLEESLALFKALGDRLNVAQSLAGLAMVSLMQGDYAVAHALLEESLALYKAVGNKWFIAECLAGFAGLAAAQGEWAKAVRLSSVAQALCQAINGVLPPPIRVMQELAATGARAQLGEEIFTAVLTEAHTMTIEQALAAQEAVTTVAMAPAGPSSVPHPPKAPTYPNGLTMREMEVLRLLAQGLTSAQIAERLVIGLVTVNSHVRSIYSKLEVTSRAAATRYALEHHLL